MKKIIYSILKKTLVAVCTYALIKGYDNFELIKSSFIEGFNRPN